MKRLSTAPYAIRRRGRISFGRQIRNNWELFVLLLPAIIIVVIFSYWPMYGLQMAFKQTRLGGNFLAGNWVGFRYFNRFFNSGWYAKVMRNTILISCVSHFLIWPIPIGLALLMHNARSSALRKFTQTVTYIPHLLSIVVVISIVRLLCDGSTGLINILLSNMGQEKINFFGRNDMVLWLYNLSGLWQNAGYSAVIYLAALSSVDSEVIEAGIIDGATKLQRILYIDIPWITPTIVTMFILSMGSMLNISADKMLLLQTDMNINASEVLSTYVYKTGIQDGQYGYAAAVGLFNNLINFTTLLIVNFAAKKISDTSLF